MAVVEFRLPDLGEGLAEVELIGWYVAVGDTVQENQTLADVESDKSIVTMPSPASGVVRALCVQPGERIKVGARFVVIEGHTSAVRERTESPPAQPGAAAPSPASTGADRASTAAVLAAPAARRLAAERGIDLAAVRGSGPKGRITVEDVEAAAAAAVTPVPADATTAGETERVPLRGIRRRIAEAMEQSYRTVPHVSGFHEFDGDALVRVHAAFKPRAESVGARLTYLAFIVQAVARTLSQHPMLNASLDDAAQEIVLKRVYHVGIATSAPDGLVVPVLHDADRLDLLAVARGIERLSAATRARTLTPRDLQGGTFTVTNVGAQRGWLNTSLIRHPEVAILGVGRIEPRAVVRDGQVVARPVLPLALTFDHRVIDGEQALDFMLALRAQLESEAALTAMEPVWNRPEP